MPVDFSHCPNQFCSPVILRCLLCLQKSDYENLQAYIDVGGSCSGTHGVIYCEICLQHQLCAWSNGLHVFLCVLDAFIGTFSGAGALVVIGACVNMILVTRAYLRHKKYTMKVWALNQSVIIYVMLLFFLSSFLPFSLPSVLPSFTSFLAFFLHLLFPSLRANGIASKVSLAQHHCTQSVRPSRWLAIR